MKRAVSSQALKCLQDIYQAEVAGIIRYLHYSFMIMGHNRIPIQNWLRAQAAESMDHAIAVGEKITSLGGLPTVTPAHIEETDIHSIDQLLKESLAHEEKALGLYKKLAKLAGRDIALEEMARGFVRLETEHVEEVKKMLVKGY
jgi:bacterioferritin